MFKQYRAFASAALAALVSVSAQAANYRLAWWTMTNYGQASGMTDANIGDRTAVLKAAGVDLMLGRGLWGKKTTDYSFSDSNGYVLLANGTLCNTGSDGNGRQFAVLSEKFSEGAVEGEINKPGTNATALRLLATDKVNGNQIVLVSHCYTYALKNNDNCKTFVNAIKEEYPGAVIIWVSDVSTDFAASEDANVTVFENEMAKTGLYPIRDTYAQDKAAAQFVVYCSDEKVAKSAVVAPLEDAETYGPFGYTIDIKVVAWRKVTFLTRDDQLIEVKECEDGSAITPPAAPEIDGLVFDGWEPSVDFSCVTADATVKASYKAAGSKHLVEFMNEGALYDSQLVDEGELAVRPEPDPEKEGHSFSGWLLGEQAYDFTTPVMDDLTLESSFAINKYTVTFKDWEGNPIEDQPQIVEWKNAAVAPALPPLPENYLFEKWSDDFSCVTQDMEIVAKIVPNRVSVTTDNFAEVITSEASALTTFELAEDIALSDWTAVDFRGTLDGKGYVIRGLDGSLFATLTGTVRDVALDGLVEGELTAVKFPKGADSGVLANVVSGGLVEDCTIVGFSISGGDVSNGIGLLAGRVENGAIIRRCVTAGQISGEGGVRSGGIAGMAVTSNDYLVDGVVLGIYDCTNKAVTVKSQGDNNTAGGCGGILGRVETGNGATTGEFRFEILRCVNEGSLQASVSGARMAGILGNLSGNSDQVHVVVSNCENIAEVTVANNLSDKYRQPVVAGLVGIVSGTANQSFMGRLDIVRCVNRGMVDIGLDTEDCLDDTANGYNKYNRIAGGLVGTSALFKNAKMHLADSANYGAVSGKWVGGIFGVHATNANYAYSDITIFNCANYGTLTGGTEVEGESLGGAGQICARNVSAKSPTRILTNCYVTGGELYVVTDTGLEFVESNVFLPTTKAKDATKALTAWAVENGYEPWKQGKLGKAVHPELGIFCQKPHVDGFMLYVR